MSEVILEAFRSGIEAGADEDQIKLSMIQAGATFKNVTKFYSEFLVSEGIVESKEEKEARITQIAEQFDLSTEEGFSGAIDALIEQSKNVDERSAAASIRWFCRKNEIAYFVKPKSEPVGNRTQGFAGRFYDALIENPTMSVEEAENIVNGVNPHPETSENTKRYMKHYQDIRALANAIAASYTK